MRGEDTQQNAMFSYLSPEQRVPQDHPVRRLRFWKTAAFVRMRFPARAPGDHAAQATGARCRSPLVAP